MTQTKIQRKFYPLTSKITVILRQAKLTAAEWRIWSYLVEVAPWGDLPTAALGQILLYSGFYPEQDARIHLFGRRRELSKLPDIEAACLAFDINVTAEEVK